MSPTRPKKLCCYPGCGVTVESGRCDRHKVADRRLSASGRGYGRDWRKLRKWFLRQQVKCHKCGALASEVHHKVPVSQRPDLRLEVSNLMALCKSCHSSVTMGQTKRGNRGFSSN